MFYGRGAGRRADGQRGARRSGDGRAQQARRPARPARVRVRGPAGPARWATPSPATTSVSTWRTRQVCSPRVAQAFAPPGREHRQRAPGRARRRRGAGAGHARGDRCRAAATVEELRDLDVVRAVASVHAGGGRGMICRTQPRRLARRDRGVPRIAAGRRPTHAGHHAARGRHAARSGAGTVRAHRLRGLSQGRGRQPHRVVQGPRDDHGDQQGGRGGQPGGHLRQHRQHLGVAPLRTPRAPG